MADIQAEGNNEQPASPREEALAARFNRRIKDVLKSPEHKSRLERWKKARQYAKGTQQDDGEDGQVRVNIIGSRLEIIQPSIYAKNPEISVTPSEQVSMQRYPLLGAFAKTLEIVLNRVLVKDGKLKQRGKAAVRASLTTTTGWVKVIYQRERAEDPEIRNRINDIQDNLQRIAHLREEVEDPDCHDPQELDAKTAELEQQLKALQAKVEVVVAEGMVIDNVMAEDIIILDESISSIDEYTQAKAIAHGVWKEKDEFEEQFGRKVPKGARTFNRRADGDDTQTTAGGGDAVRTMIRVWEVWDLQSQTVYTLAEGADRFIREPWIPPRMGEQWYPFFPLQLKRVDGDMMPPSLVEDLIELQDEYNTTRTNFAEAREESKPGLLFDKSSGILDTEIQAIKDRKMNDAIGVTKDKNERLDALFADIPTPDIDPAVYDTTPILRDVELVSGAQDAAAGSVQVAKTATEAEILKSGENTRTGERLDVIEDWLTEIATYSAQVLLQEMTPAQVKRIAGEEAVWPQLSKSELFDLVEVSIRAGSTAKPNRAREREQWSTLLPTITDMVSQYNAAITAGALPAAKALRKLLEETLRRFDERLNVDDFLPPLPTVPAAPMAPAGALANDSAQTEIAATSHGGMPPAVSTLPEPPQVQ